MLQPAPVAEPTAGLVPLGVDEPEPAAGLVPLGAVETLAAAAPSAGSATSNISTIPTAVQGQVSTSLSLTQ